MCKVINFGNYKVNHNQIIEESDRKRDLDKFFDMLEKKLGKDNIKIHRE